MFLGLTQNHAADAVRHQPMPDTQGWKVFVAKASAGCLQGLNHNWHSVYSCIRKHSREVILEKISWPRSLVNSVFMDSDSQLSRNVIMVALWAFRANSKHSDRDGQILYCVLHRRRNSSSQVYSVVEIHGSGCWLCWSCSCPYFCQSFS